MSFNILLWEVDKTGLVELAKERLDNEDRLEEWIAQDVSLIGIKILIIGRQIRTPSGGRIDLLAINEQGDLVILELKRDRTPREVVAQALDYASWVADLLPEAITKIAEDYLSKPLPDAFHERFGTSVPEVINNDHRIVIVASELDDSSERIVHYLSTRHLLNINVVFFTCFRQGKKEFVGRAWLLDPEEVEERSEGRRSSKWTGFWFVNVGENDYRNWDDCIKYGFVAAGWGRGYTDALCKLQPGCKLFAYMKGRGYVGYGECVREACPVTAFTPFGHKKRLLELPIAAKEMDHTRNDQDQCEWVAAVKWQKTFPREQAKSFAGIFANPQIVCRLRDQRTLEFLRREFNVTN